MNQPTLFAKTQTERLLDHFEAGGTITTFEATLNFRITQLARCIDDLEKLGHRFEKTWETTEGGAHIKRYKLIKER